jgi:hypothetical protein
MKYNEPGHQFNVEQSARMGMIGLEKERGEERD